MPHRLAVPLAITALTALVAGCSSSGSTKPNGSSGSDPGNATMAAGKPATGAPITVGLLNQENTPAGSFPEYREGATAATSLINAQLGGVAGRPIKLVTCITDGTPATSTQCARQFVSQHVVVVIEGLDFGVSSAIPILAQAKIPLLGSNPLSAPELTNSYAFQFDGGSVSEFAAQVRYLVQTLKAKRVNILYVANSQGETAAKEFIQAPLNKLGVTDVKLASAAQDAADFTGPLQQITSNQPDAVMVLFAAQGCSRVMVAQKSIGVPSSTKFFYPPSCTGVDVVKAGGAGAEGAYFSQSFLLPGSSDPQVRQYEAAMAKYAKGTPPSGFAQGGFAEAMNAYNLLKKNPSSVSAASMTSALKSTKNEPSYMGHPYTCDGKQLPGFPSLCNTYTRIVQYTNGSLHDVDNNWISGTG